MKPTGKKGDEWGIFFLFFSAIFFVVERRYAIGQRAPIFDKCLIWINIGSITNKRKLSSPNHVSVIEINPREMVSLFLMLKFSVF